jgi:hypothetical protein
MPSQEPCQQFFVQVFHGGPFTNCRAILSPSIVCIIKGAGRRSYAARQVDPAKGEKGESFFGREYVSMMSISSQFPYSAIATTTAPPSISANSFR